VWYNTYNSGLAMKTLTDGTFIDRALVDQIYFRMAPDPPLGYELSGTNFMIDNVSAYRAPNGVQNTDMYLSYFDCSDGTHTVTAYFGYKTWSFPYRLSSEEFTYQIVIGDRVRFTRLGASSRYLTAVEVSKHGFPNGAPAAVVAFGGNFPDALCAAPLAHAYGGPVLLTPTAALPDAVIAELTRLAPSRVFVVGSGTVVSPHVQTQLGQLASHPTVTRLGGAGRFETAAMVSDTLRAKSGSPGRVVVVNGYGYADALSAAPLAAAKGWPILLTRTAAMPAATTGAVSRSGASTALVVGSNTAVSEAVKSALPSATRAGGSNRYETCARVLDFAVGQGCSYRHLALATGVNFPDALAAGPLLAVDDGLLLLTPPAGLPTCISTRLTARKAIVTDVDTIGSTSVVPQACVEAVRAAVH
jgi:putative cell wall-binding protein